MPISGHTTVVGIFGDPIGHSLSPLMQNAAIASGALDAVYVPFHVPAGQLAEAVAGLRALQIRGVNLTIPHKEAACSLVDELDAQAALIGAINTIVNCDGHLTGYNTDGIGLLAALKRELQVTVAGARVLLLGAGGACRAAVAALCQEKVAWLGIANRTRARSQALIDEFAPVFPGTIFAEYGLNETLVEQCPQPVDLLVNSSALGLKGERLDFCVTRCVQPGGAVFDMVYGAEPSPLLVDARASNLSTANGLAMLIGQGEAAFQLWFGVAPKRDVMRLALESAAATG